MGTDASPYKVIECLLYRVLAQYGAKLSKASLFGGPYLLLVYLPTYYFQLVQFSRCSRNVSNVQAMQ